MTLGEGKDTGGERFSKHEAKNHRIGLFSQGEKDPRAAGMSKGLNIG